DVRDAPRSVGRTHATDGARAASRLDLAPLAASASFEVPVSARLFAATACGARRVLPLLEIPFRRCVRLRSLRGILLAPPRSCHRSVGWGMGGVEVGRAGARAARSPSAGWRWRTVRVRKAGAVRDLE